MDETNSLIEQRKAKLAALRAHDSQLGAWEGLEGFVVGMAETIATASGTGLRQAESFKAFFFD